MSVDNLKKVKILVLGDTGLYNIFNVKEWGEKLYCSLFALLISGRAKRIIQSLQ